MSKEGQITRAPPSGTPDVVANGGPVQPQVSFIENSKNFLGAMRQLASHDGANILEGLIDTNEHLQQQVEAFGQVNTTQATRINHLQKKLREGEEKTALHQKKEEETQKANQELQKAKAKFTDEINGLKEEKKKLISKSNAIENRIKELAESLKKEKDNSTLLDGELKRLRNVEINYNEIQGFSMTLFEGNTDKIAAKMDVLLGDACSLISSYFLDDTPEPVLQDDEIWRSLRHPDLFNHDIPLPRTNSTPAKEMRFALVLTILSRAIDHHLFQPSYLLDEESGLRLASLRQAIHNSKHESHFRSILLGFGTRDESDKERADRVASVVREMRAATKLLLPLDRAASFRKRLEQFAWQACEVWSYVRQVRERYEPSFELTHVENVEWQTFDFEEGKGHADGEGTATSATASSGSGSRKEPNDFLLVVFPRLYLVENNQKPETVTAGLVLKRSQTLAASKELEPPRRSEFDAATTSPRITKANPKKLSISLPNGEARGSFLETKSGGSKGHGSG